MQSPTVTGVAAPRRPARRSTGVLLGLVVAVAGAAAGDRGEPIADTIDVVEVEVPVQVLLAGHPVRGLTRDDFILVVGGRRQPILGFSTIDLQEPSDAGGDDGTSAPPPLAARRHILLLFDLTFAEPSRIARARDAAVVLVGDRLHPTDLVSVATISLASGIRVLLEFTPDHRQVAEALTNLGQHAPASPRDPLGLVFGGSSVVQPATPGPADALARRGRLAPEEGGDAVLQAQRDQHSFVLLGHAHQDMAALLTELAASLRTVAGQKHVYYLSEGADSSALLGVGRGATATERQRIEATNEAAMRGDVWAVDSDMRFGSTRVLGRFEAMTEEFVRAGATLQSVDVGGLRAEHDGGAPGDDTLFMLADRTGGQYLRNHNDLTLGMSKLLARTAVTYLLTFEAPAGRGRGDFEPIKVRLAERLRGATLFHRPGYFEPLPFAARSPFQRRAEAAQWLLDERRRDGLSLEVDVRVSPEAAADGTNVTVELSVPKSDLPLAGGEVEYYGYAFTPDGRIAGFFEHVAARADATGDDGFARVQGRLALAPGAYDLRLLARDSVLGTVATRVHRIEVGGG